MGPAADQVSVTEAHLSSTETAGKSGRELRVVSFHEQSPRQFQLFAAYTAFIAALLMLALSVNWPKAWVAVTLFAISLPALVALLFLDQVVRIQGQRKKGLRAAALLLGTVPSVMGTAILIGRVSLVAAALFNVSVLFWVFVVGLAVRLENGENSDAPR